MGKTQACGAEFNFAIHCEKTGVHAIHHAHRNHSTDQYVTWEGDARHDPKLVNVRYWGHQGEMNAGWCYYIGPTVPEEPKTPVGLTVSDDGGLINWQGRNYVAQDTLDRFPRACDNPFAHRPLTLTFTGPRIENAEPSSYHFDGTAPDLHWLHRLEELPIVDRAVMIALCKELVRRMETEK